MADTVNTQTLPARNTLGLREEQLSKIGDPARILGPEAALGVSARALPLTRHFNLRVDTATPALAAVEAVLGCALPGVSSWCSDAAGRTVVWLGPDEWLILDTAEAGLAGDSALEAALREALSRGGGAVVEQTGQRLSLLLGGDAVGLLAKGTGLDLRSAPGDNFAVGAALQGFLVQAIVVYLSREDGVELLVRTSFARYMADWLLDAASGALASATA